MKKLIFYFFIFLSASLIIPRTLYAILNPQEVLVVANMNARRSVSLAKYYLKKRNIPKKNLLKIWCTDSETISRKNYNKKIKLPIQEFLKRPDMRQIRCILLIYGIPIKVKGTPPTLLQETELKNLSLKRDILKKQISEEKNKNKEKRLQKKLRIIQKKLTRLNLILNTSASVDSELSLVKVNDYPLSFWLPNPYFLPNQNKTLKFGKQDVILVSRLDGPSPDIVKRIINDSIYAENHGLKGRAYFDARWKLKKNITKLNAYGYYDYSIHLAAREIKRSRLMKVILDDSPKLFQKGQCMDAALYCGWYSLGHYIDAFKWVRGAVGYHIASIECSTLRNKNSNIWCVKMLEKGVAATIGPVSEPYVQAFPVPHIFFGTLIDGYWSLVESYYLSLPYISWKMVLIGDPMYRPFKNK